MKTRVKSIVVGIALLVLSFAYSSTVLAVEPAWGDTVGPVSAVVGRTDTEQGLAVRAEPSPESETLGYLPVGTTIRGYHEFSRGWMRLRNPFEGGWVHVDYLEPQGGTAEVISVDKPAGCLNIRSGPGSSYPKVGCAALGDELALTGVWSENNWAELANPVGAWVFAGQIRSALEPAYPPKSQVAREFNYEEEPLPYYDFNEPSVVYNYIYRYPPLYWTDRYYALDLFDGYWPYGGYGYWPYRYYSHRPHRYYSYGPHRYKGYKYWGKRHPKYGVRIGGKKGGRKFGRYAHYPKKYSSLGHRTYNKYRSRSFKSRSYGALKGRGHGFSVKSRGRNLRISPQRGLSARSGRGFSIKSRSFKGRSYGALKGRGRGFAVKSRSRGLRISPQRGLSGRSGRGFSIGSTPRRARASAFRSGNFGGSISAARSRGARIGAFRGRSSRGHGIRSRGSHGGGFRGGFRGRRGRR